MKSLSTKDTGLMSCKHNTTCVHNLPKLLTVLRIERIKPAAHFEAIVNVTFGHSCKMRCRPGRCLMKENSSGYWQIS